MKHYSLWRGGRQSIRTRVLAIALVPSAALLAVGVGASIYLVGQGLQAREWSSRLSQASLPANQLIQQVSEERRMSLLRLTGDTMDTTGLTEVRTAVDGSLARLNGMSATLAKLNPSGNTDTTNGLAQVAAKLPVIRAAIDTRTLPRSQALAFYNGLIGSLGQGLERIMGTVKDSQAALAMPTALDLFNIADAMSRSNALAAGALSAGGMTPTEFASYRQDVSGYHLLLPQVVSRLTPHGMAQYKAMVGGVAWQRVVAVENALLQRGPGRATGPSSALPVVVDQWHAAVDQVSNDLFVMDNDHFRLALQQAAARGQSTFSRSILAGVLVLLLAGLAFLVAFRLSTGLVRRLVRLRQETLQLADERLPHIVEMLRVGKTIDVAVEVPRLDYGSDEIGQVADAFNKAQQTAVWAAEREAKAREGMNAVFLNIAHRSQMVAHRQLEVLDEAERKQEDPRHLELLFRIDHLATRARRNAENLVILGGERPGRKWRRPVPLDEIARGAIAETENFARVTTARLPDVLVEGTIVADLVHLLAELVDNATTFSPPGTRVEVRGNMVGKGVVVEVEDQGLGMTPELREQLNAMLHDPPDFQIMALGRHTRLGLFVVAQLANRHGVRVTLAESAYGGSRAIVLIPSAQLTIKPGLEERPSGSGEPSALPSQRQQLYAPGQRHPRTAALTSGNGSRGLGAQRPQGDLPPLPPNGQRLYSPREPAQPTRPDGGIPPAVPNGTPAGPPSGAVPGGNGFGAGSTGFAAGTNGLGTGTPAGTPAGAHGAAPGGAHGLAGPNGGGQHGTGSNGTGSNGPVGGAHAGSNGAAHRVGGDGRAPLPRRQRQANLAPQLAAEVTTGPDLAPSPAPEMSPAADLFGPAPTGAARSPEEVRDTMSAMLRGTRQGRQAADPDSGTVPDDEGS